MRQARVLVLGYLSIDTLHGGAAPSRQVPGGGALYAALGARHAGAQASIAAAVGADYPQTWLRSLAQLGIGIADVQRRPGATRQAVLAYDTGGARSSPHFQAAAWWERTHALAPPLPADMAAFDLLVAAPMPVQQLRRLLQQAAQAGVRVVGDTSAAFVAEDREQLLQCTAGLAAFAPSREETQGLFPQMDDDEAAIALAARGVDVLHKRAANGAVAVRARSTALVRIPAPAADVRDPTGAGDATVGALAAHLASGRDFVAAATAALATGALATSGVGPAALGFEPHALPAAA